MDFVNYLYIAIRAALDAGKSIMDIYMNPDADFEIETKADNSPLTLADKASNRLIVSALSVTPFPILSEEEKEIPFEERKKWTTLWIVDPLDGTVNYMHGLPHWAISVALEEKGEVVAAVTYAPVINEMYWTEKGRGAYLNDQKIRVSSKRSLPEILVSFGNLAESKLPPIARLPLSVRKLGAMTLDMAYLAAGRLDLLYSSPNSNPWDIAAGALLIREAGGVLADSSARSVTSYDKIEMMANIDLLDVVRKYQNAN